MYLQNLHYQGVRNLVPGQLTLGQGLNIFYGSNGAGKSSILEAIALLTSGRSFRTTKLEKVLSHDSLSFAVFGQTDTARRMGIGYTGKDKKKVVKVDGQRQSNLSALSAIYPTQVISPESYHLIDSGPSERRKYLDWCLFHVEHSFHNDWKRYSGLLKQRNALLRTRPSGFAQQLEIWDSQLVEIADFVTDSRRSVLTQLKDVLELIIQQLDIDFCEGLTLSYYAGYTGDFKTKLNESRSSDIEHGFTRFGPHKADIRIKIKNELAREFLSRGQKKVLINAMYLAQTQLLKTKEEKDSLFIVDDFGSELDQANQKALLSALMAQKNVQIILSCLQHDSLKWLKKGYNNAHMFHVEHGQIRPIETILDN